MVGKWDLDPSVLSDQANAAEKGTTFQLTADHQYQMAVPKIVTVKGTWSFANAKMTATPTSFVIPSPADPNKFVNLPVDVVLKEAQDMPGDPKMQAALQTMAKETIFDVSPDGKKMSENGKPALVKLGTGS